MIELKNKVFALDIKKDFKGLLYELILAETFNMRRSSHIEFDIQRHKSEYSGDKRLWAKVKIKTDEVREYWSVYPARPFIDHSCKVNLLAETIELEKDYYLYEE